MPAPTALRLANCSLAFSPSSWNFSLPHTTELSKQSLSEPLKAAKCLRGAYSEGQQATRRDDRRGPGLVPQQGVLSKVVAAFPVGPRSGLRRVYVGSHFGHAVGSKGPFSRSTGSKTRPKALRQASAKPPGLVPRWYSRRPELHLNESRRRRPPGHLWSCSNRMRGISTSCLEPV